MTPSDALALTELAPNKYPVLPDLTPKKEADVKGGGIIMPDRPGIAAEPPDVRRGQTVPPAL